MLKWVGTVACVLIAVGFVTSRWSGFACVAGGWGIALERGVVAVGRDPTARSGLLIHNISPPDILWSWPIWADRSVPYGFVALWIPFFIVLIPTVLLWLRDRQILPGYCEHCGYDLTGNVSGRCPECGKSIEGETA